MLPTSISGEAVDSRNCVVLLFSLQKLFAVYVTVVAVCLGWY